MINRSRFIPKLQNYQEFSIRILVSSHPLVGYDEDSVAPSLADTYAPSAIANSLFQADPFIVLHEGFWYLFYEAFKDHEGKGVICALQSNDLKDWESLGTVLEEPYHVSFPHVFAWDDSWWMIPETGSAARTYLYRSIDFPYKWEKAALLFDFPVFDSHIWEHEGRYYIFTAPTMRTLLLYYADRPLGPWRQHPMSPIVKSDLRTARPGGPIAHIGKKMYRFGQDCFGTYGRQLFAFEILELSETAYKERPACLRPKIGPGKERWRANGMHHLHTTPMPDGRWISVMDGWRWRRRWQS